MVLINDENKETVENETSKLTIEELKIEELTINEFYPSDNIYKSGPILKKEDLTTNIQLFFAEHILNGVINNQRSRTGRFSTQTSSILSDIKNILNINKDSINKTEFEFLMTESQKQEDFDEPTKRFYYFSDNISKKFKHTLTNQAKNEFLLIIIKCTHTAFGDMVAILKMEKVLGVQYTDRSLQEQIDMLPDKKSGLQKAAVIFKEKLITFKDLESFKKTDKTNEKDAYHTKIVDKQDATISKSFIEAFLGNSIVHKNAENTTSAFNQIKIYFQDYLLNGIVKKDIEKFLKENNEFGSTTTVKNLVEKVINDSNLIDKEKLIKKDIGIDNIANDIYSEMQKHNSSASAEFDIEFRKIPKFTFNDVKSEGKLVKLVVAQSSIETQEVILDANIKDLSSITNWEDKVFIAINKDLINLKLD